MRVDTLRHLTLAECAMAMAALPLVAAVRVALWVLPSRVILRVVSRFESVKHTDEPSSRVTASTVVWAVEAVSRRMPGATCLTQALAGKLLLRGFGYQSRLCLGVAHTSDGALRAHAWLERDGRAVLGGTGIRSLVRLPDLPRDARIHASLIR